MPIILFEWALFLWHKLRSVLGGFDGVIDMFLCTDRMRWSDELSQLLPLPQAFVLKTIFPDPEGQPGQSSKSLTPSSTSRSRSSGMISADQTSSEASSSSPRHLNEIMVFGLTWIMLILSTRPHPKTYETSTASGYRRNQLKQPNHYCRAMMAYGHRFLKVHNWC